MYRIVFTRQAARALQKAPKHIVQQVKEKLALIASDPFSQHRSVTKLQNRPGYRLRVGDWRVIYEIQKEDVIILVLNIAPRGEVYR